MCVMSPQDECNWLHVYLDWLKRSLKYPFVFQLEEHIMRLREQLDREREERNYFQLERDKIHTFWEITDSKLEEVTAEKKNFDKDMEEDEGRHQVEIKVRFIHVYFSYIWASPKLYR